MKQTINIGTAPNTGDGEPIRTGGDKINDNFTELYDLLEGGAAGQFLRGAGVATLSAWSTLTIPATISAKSIFVANSANTLVEITPAASQSIRMNAGNTAWEAFTAGDVLGPSSSTDNAIARFDLATGKLIQESPATLSDTGDMVLGTSSLAGTVRALSVAGSGSNVGLSLISKGSSSVLLVPESALNGLIGINSVRSFIEFQQDTRLQINANGNTIGLTSASTNSKIEVLTLAANSSGTPAAGIGASIAMGVETSANNVEKGVVLSSVATDVTGGAEYFSFAVSTMANGATADERIRINNNGFTIAANDTPAGSPSGGAYFWVDSVSFLPKWKTPGGTVYTLSDTGAGGVSDGDYGDITVSGVGTVWTIDGAAVSYAKIQNVAANSFLANVTGAPATVQEIATTRIPLFGSAITGTANGTTFLRGDGAWAAPTLSYVADNFSFFNASPNFQSGVDIIYIGEATTEPSAAPSSGVFMWAKTVGSTVQLHVMDSAGNVRVI